MDEIKRTREAAKASCVFCNKKIDIERIVLFDQTVVAQGFTPCDCDGYQRAIKKREDIARQEEAKSREKREAELYEARRKKLLGESGIKKRFQQRTLKNFDVDYQNREAFKKSCQYVKYFEELSKEGTGLYFSGGYGTGKTHLATGIALALIDRHKKVICMTSIDLLNAIKATYDGQEQWSEDDVIKIYTEADLLVIDDFGKEYQSDWALMQLYRIINDRYENLKPIIITTNYTDSQLISRLGGKNNRKTAGAIVSRLREMTGSIVMVGRDRRQK